MLRSPLGRKKSGYRGEAESLFFRGRVGRADEKTMLKLNTPNFLRIATICIKMGLQANLKYRYMEAMDMGKLRVTVWNEFKHEQEDSAIAAVYPKGIHAAISDFLGKKTDAEIKTATMYDENQGLGADILDNTDVLVYWAHKAHNLITDENVARIRQRVLEGMGLILLHSAHESKIFKMLMGTDAGKLRWREAGELERLWVIEPGHPIAAGLGEYFELEHEETYGERFDIPAPDTLVFISWFSGGEVFRSGGCYNRGAGKIFYFRPGHESFPIYYDENVQQVITNAVNWARPNSCEPVRPVFGKCPVSPEEIYHNGKN